MKVASTRRAVDKLSRTFTPAPTGVDFDLTTLISRDSSAMICRLGSVELAAMRRLAIVRKFGLGRLATQLMKGPITRSMATNAGVHPSEPRVVMRVAEKMLTDLAEADVVGRWNNFLEGWIISQTAPSAATVPLTNLDPFHGQNPWTRALENRQVLVIHPFASTIANQYERRHLVFPEGSKILPTMKLEVFEAVQSIGGHHPAHGDWFESLAVMESAIENSPAEIVLIGAGAYGLSLAATAKRNGKIGLHLGGGLQLLFGIRGARWDGNPTYERLATPFWVRPSPEETPSDAAKVEGGCYW